MMVDIRIWTIVLILVLGADEIWLATVTNGGGSPPLEEVFHLSMYVWYAMRMPSVVIPCNYDICQK